MTDALDEYVEKAARAIASLEPGEDWPTNAALGGNGTGTRDDEYRGALTDQAREVLEAIGLPALLERVEAEVRESKRIGAIYDRINTQRVEAEEAVYALTQDRDAVAAKVADAGERIAQAIEAAPWCPCSDSHCVQRQTYANAALIARAALTEGTEGT